MQCSEPGAVRAQQGGRKTALTFFTHTAQAHHCPARWRWRKQQESSVAAALDPNTPLL